MKLCHVGHEIQGPFHSRFYCDCGCDALCNQLATARAQAAAAAASAAEPVVGADGNPGCTFHRTGTSYEEQVGVVRVDVSMCWCVNVCRSVSMCVDVCRCVSMCHCVTVSMCVNVSMCWCIDNREGGAVGFAAVLAACWAFSVVLCCVVFCRVFV